MIKIVAENFVAEKHVAEFLDLVKVMVAETKNEKGCIDYGLYQDAKDPLHFTFIEEWEDMEAIGQHQKSAHYTKIIPQISLFREKDGTVCLYTKVL